MKGATTDPWVSIISMPNINKIIIIGRSQNFFLAINKANISEMSDNIFKIVSDIAVSNYAFI